MDNFLEKLLYDAMGAAIVVGALFALALIVRLFVQLANKRSKDDESPEIVEESPAASAIPYAQGGLNLHDVDDKTAALIMAIVSHESGIALSELQFNSIRLLKS